MRLNASRACLASNQCGVPHSWRTHFCAKSGRPRLSVPNPVYLFFHIDSISAVLTRLCIARKLDPGQTLGLSTNQRRSRFSVHVSNLLSVVAQ